MAHAHMPEGIEYVLMGEHAARERNVVADLIEAVGHAIFLILDASRRAARKPL
jgi:phosphoribosylformimino-5-aminoimidazole carboxamide ribonucleotide (ProFAR) isomerase